MENFLYIWLPRIFGCHCLDSRSFYYKGTKFPICARCSGELVGIIFASFSFFMFNITTLQSIILLFPMIIDGFFQMFTKYRSNNFKRFITGFLFGYGLTCLFIISTITAYNFGITLKTN